MLSDIEIAKGATLKPITEIAEKLGLNADDIEAYGKYKAKVSLAAGRRTGKLILVTAMNPTPLGEGKTTVSIGLSDGLNRLGKRVCLALREPSLGPVFGIKGGACGGGYSQVVPMEDINLHFNGDFHAVTYANNLLSALIDNHITQGNDLDIQRVVWRRCIDLNDRALRAVTVGLGGEKNGIPREDGFTITAASEIMAILCLSTSIKDLKRRLGNILVGYDTAGREIHARDLTAEHSMAILLKDALRPNLVQTLEGTPAFIHGGPFANIAHGCNTVLATRAALSYADYAVTEAGFGAELGAEKFYDIKCRTAELVPDATVLVVTLRSVKYNAGLSKEEAGRENLAAVSIGFSNVKRHIKNITEVFGQRLVVAVNRFYADTEAEIALLTELCRKEGVPCVISEGFSKGGAGCILLAETVLKTMEQGEKQLRFSYGLAMGVKEKIEAVAKKVYGAKEVVYSEEAEKSIQSLSDAYRKFPVCIAKTQYSFSSDATRLGAPEAFSFEVKDVLIRAGAEFLVVQCGAILLMPGLSKVPCAVKMTLSDEGEIDGLM